MSTLVQPKRPARHKMAKDARDFFINDRIRLPGDFAEFDSFRNWCRSDQYPERGDVDQLARPRYTLDVR